MRETAPATPPAIKEAKMGLLRVRRAVWRALMGVGGVEGVGEEACLFGVSAVVRAGTLALLCLYVLATLVLTF